MLESSKSRDGVIDHGSTIAAVLEVYTLPLIVHVSLMVDVSVDNGRHHVNEEEHGDDREEQSDKVAREHDIDLTIALKGAPRFQEALVVRSGGEERFLLAEAWDVKIDSSSKLGFDLEALDHLNNLALFLVRRREVRSNLPKILVDIVLHDRFSLFLFIIINK